MDEATDIDAIEEIVAALDARIASCRQAMLLSRGAAGCGILVLAAALSVVPAMNTAAIVLSSITAIIGGLVWLGASGTSLAEAELRRAEAEERRATLFDAVAAQHGWTMPSHSQ